MIEKIKKVLPYIATIGAFFFWLGGTKFADKEQNTLEHQDLKTASIEMKKDIEYIKCSVDEIKRAVNK